jgi:hypothetical protein
MSEPIRKPTQDELLEEMHNDYINKVTDSGYPLWMMEVYGPSISLSIPSLSNREVSTPESEKNTNQDLPF